MAIGIMEVKLVGAKRLKNADFLSMNGSQWQGRNPIWNEKFEFRVDYPLADEQYKLVLKLMDYDTFTADDYLGQATIYVKELIELGFEKGKAELRPRKYRIVFTDKTYRGEIQVGITFTTKEETDDEEEYGGWKESNY